MHCPTPSLIFDVSQRSYTVIDNWLFEAPLSIHEKMTFIALKRHAWSDSKCFPSLRTLAADISSSPDTVSRALRGLMDKGLVRCVSGKEKGVPNVYLVGPFAGELAPEIQDAIEKSNKILKITEGTADSGRGTADSGRGVPQTAAGGTADSGRGAADSGSKKEEEKKRNLSLSYSLSQKTDDDDKRQTRETTLILDLWKKTWGPLPGKVDAETIRAMDFMLGLHREEKIKPRSALAYLAKCSPPEAFESIVSMLERENVKNVSEGQIRRKNDEVAKQARAKNEQAKRAWDALPEIDRARFDHAFPKFRAQWKG